MTNLDETQQTFMDTTARDRDLLDADLLFAMWRDHLGQSRWTGKYWFDDRWRSSCEPGPGRTTPHFHEGKKRALMCAARSWRIERWLVTEEVAA